MSLKQKLIDELHTEMAERLNDIDLRTGLIAETEELAALLTECGLVPCTASVVSAGRLSRDGCYFNAWVQAAIADARQIAEAVRRADLEVVGIDAWGSSNLMKLRFRDIEPPLVFDESITAELRLLLGLRTLDAYQEAERICEGIDAAIAAADEKPSCAA